MVLTPTPNPNPNRNHNPNLNPNLDPNTNPRYVGKTTRVGGATAAQVQAGQGLAWPCDLVLSLANRPQTIAQLKQPPTSQPAAQEPRPFALPHAPPAPDQAQGGLQPRPASANWQKRSGWPAIPALCVPRRQLLNGQSVTRSTLESLERNDVDSTLRSICRADAASRRCIQQAGEIMFVPDMWGHEIFNLEPTVGVQAMYTT